MTDSTREPRHRDDPQQQRQHDPTQGDTASGAREEANELLRLGENIIARTLTGNSLDFLRANRQDGGQ